jgi:AraC-like DNA-binding protein
MSTVIKMLINYDIEKLNKALQDFYNSTGVNIQLLTSDFMSLSSNPRNHNNYCKCIQSTAEGKKSCYYSDKKLLEKCKESKQPQMHICHAGLIDVAVPILYNDEILGYIILGQMKKEYDFTAVEKNILDLGLDLSQMREYYSSLSVFDYDKIQSVSSIASMLATYILLENMLKPKINSNLEKAIDFIEKNLEKDLSIQNISKSMHISQSVLYRNFRNYYGCTVGEYINTRRVEKSIEIMKNMDLSIEEISQSVGFASATYYGRVFKSKKGITPLKYRKLQNN